MATWEWDGQNGGEVTETELTTRLVGKRIVAVDRRGDQGMQITLDDGDAIYLYASGVEEAVLFAIMPKAGS